MNPTTLFLVSCQLLVVLCSAIEFQVVRKDCEPYRKTIVVMGLYSSSPKSIFTKLVNRVPSDAISSRKILCYYVQHGKCLRICKIPSFYNTRSDNQLDHYAFHGQVIKEMRAQISYIDMFIYAHAPGKKEQSSFLEFWSKSIPSRATSIVAMTGSFLQDDIKDAKRIFRTKNIITSDADTRAQMFDDLNTQILEFLLEHKLKRRTKTNGMKKLDKLYKRYMEKYVYLTNRFEQLRSDIIHFKYMISDPVEMAKVKKIGVLAYILQHFIDGSSDTALSSTVAEYQGNIIVKQSTFAEAEKLLPMIEAACKKTGNDALEVQAAINQARQAVQADSESQLWMTERIVYKLLREAFELSNSILFTVGNFEFKF